MRKHAQNEKKSTDSYEELLSIVAQNIKRCRIVAGLTQEDMRNRGFNYRFYQRLESGSTNATIFTLYRVASALGVPVAEFFNTVATHRKKKSEPT